MTVHKSVFFSFRAFTLPHADVSMNTDRSIRYLTLEMHIDSHSARSRSVSYCTVKSNYHIESIFPLSEFS